VAAIIPNLDKVATHFDKALTKNQIERYQKQTETAVEEVVKKESAEFEIAKAHISVEYADKPEVRQQRFDDAQRTFVEKVAEKTQEAVNNQAKTIVREQEQKQEQRKVNTAMEDVRSRLRGFARTIPSFIMAYGNRELTLANFDDYTPDDVFEELTGITEAQFCQLRDGMTITDEDGTTHTVPGLFDAPTFDTSVQEFLDKKEKLADYFDEKQVEDISDYIPPQKTNQIFTPKRIVKLMVDLLEKENPEIFTNSSTKFIDLYAKSGLYIAELVKRLNKGLEAEIPDEHARIKHILENQVYAVAPSNIIYNIVKNFIFNDLSDISADNIRECDLVPVAQAGNVKEKLEEIYGDDMKFDVVIGNPPYQEQGEARDEPIYHNFMDEAYKVADKVCLITPARFLFNAGQTPSSWNKKMLSDNHFKVEYFEQISSKIFPNTDIKGGIAVTYRDEKKDFGAIGVFTPILELNSIVKKVVTPEMNSLTTIVYPQGIYRFSPKFFAEFPNAETMQGSGTKNKIVSKSFATMDFAFLSKKQNEDDVKMLGLISGKREYRYIRREFISVPETFESWKVFIPEANGSGAIGEVLSTPLVGHTDTFLTIGNFDNQTEAENLLKYVKSKFARTMLGVLKVTQHNSRATWAKVPIQDFTANSDIDWTKTIPEIDLQLCKKYNLDKEEILFIEGKVKEMD
jgi:type I restriction-modification system DNA methylase subunit